MKTLIMLVLLIAGSAAAATPAPTRTVKETLGAFIGTWHMDLFADAETFGERGGPGSGTMNCSWGPMEAWVDCDLDSSYEGLGRYALKIVLYRAGGEGTYGAFVTNNFGGGRLYLGQWASRNELVYVDAWVDPERKWEHQRTTYTFHDNGELSFAIEVSKDGMEYLPHSRGTYRRK